MRLTLADGAALRSLDFDLGSTGDYSDFKADGQWQAAPPVPAVSVGSGARQRQGQPELPGTPEPQHQEGQL
ncbi:hypothetical protein PBOI14_18840 [Pseudomonas sp. Boi14]|nr:hypothetical protein PBOI14_18840 [Pseudomonas sp. Boi14]